MSRRFALLAVMTAIAIGVPAAHAATQPINSGVITVGQGANGAALGMSRAQVITALGKPLSENKNGVMSYEPDTSGVIFDVYRDGGGRGTHVRMFIIAAPGHSGFTLQDGNRVFTKGGMRRVFKHYGSHLRFHNSGDSGPYYELITKLHGKKVLTDFAVDRHSPDARVLDVFILFA